MSPKFVGIAGGTGAGKSTVCISLIEAFPEQIGLVHLDDYFNKREVVPVVDGMVNWDHPGAINFQKLIDDLEELRAGRAITIMTKSEKYNPRYKEIGKIALAIEPKPIVLVEGYLALWDRTLRNSYSTSFFLDVPHDIRIHRRTKFVDQRYFDRVLVPMHEKFVETTKRFASHVIDVGTRPVEQVFAELRKIVEPLLSTRS